MTNVVSIAAESLGDTLEKSIYSEHESPWKLLGQYSYGSIVQNLKMYRTMTQSYADREHMELDIGYCFLSYFN